MNLDRLHIFLATVDTGTVSAAARRVHLTQPAASRNLQLLEEQLGAHLFHRKGRRLVLTAAGRALIPRARRLIEEARLAQRAISKVAERQFFDLRLGAVDSVVTYLLPRIIAPIREAFPELHLKVHTNRTGDLLSKLANDHLDLAVCAWSGTPPVERYHDVGEYELQFYGRKDEFPELAEINAEDDLTQFPIVEIESLSGQPTVIPEDAPSYGVASSLASVKSLVMGGFGVGALLSFMVSDEELSVLAKAQVPHDPNCRLYVVASPFWSGESELAIEELIASALSAA